MDEEFIKKIKNNTIEYACGSYEVGRYAWIFDDIKPIKPIKTKDKLNIWTYNDK